jgi:GntR family transcriptional regulator / MocR family aminotransferase
MLGHRPPAGDLNRGKPRNWRDYRYPFIYGQADPTLFDHANWRLCMMQSLGLKDFDRMSDDQFEQDDPGLLEYIARHSLPRRGILAHPDEVLVTLGAQNALWLSAQLLLNQRRSAVIEEPGYPGLRDILNQTRCRVCPCPWARAGSRLRPCPRRSTSCSAPRATIAPPGRPCRWRRGRRCSPPPRRRTSSSSRTTTNSRSPRAARRCPRSSRSTGAGRVIHVGSFSKSMFPGLRLGFLVGPAPFIARRARCAPPSCAIRRGFSSARRRGSCRSAITTRCCGRLSRSFAARRAVMLAAIRAEGLQDRGRERGRRVEPLDAHPRGRQRHSARRGAQGTRAC